MGMICSYVDIGEPEPVIRDDMVDFGGAELLLSLATNTPSRWRARDFLGGEWRGGEVELAASRQMWLGGVTGPSLPVVDR